MHCLLDLPRHKSHPNRNIHLPLPFRFVSENALFIFPQSSHSNTPTINANILAFVHLKCTKTETSANQAQPVSQSANEGKMARNLYKLMPMATQHSSTRWRGRK